MTPLKDQDSVEFVTVDGGDIKILLSICVCVCVSDGKQSACNAGDLDSIPGLGRSPGERNGNPLQYSCLENSMDRGACRLQFMGLQSQT